MKRELSLVFLMFLIMCSSSIAYSQDENTIVDINSVWSINNQIVYPMPPTSYYIHLNGDTVVDSKHYTKVWTNNSLSLTNDMEFYGLIREQNQKTYFRNYHSSLDSLYEESLIYDFSLTENDTFMINILDTVVYLDVSVGMFNLNNMAVKKITLSNPLLSQDIVWVEKIGNLKGLFHNQFICGVMTDLLCYYQRNNVLYSNPEFNYCSLSLDEPIKKEEKAIIYPNPVRDLLNIESKEMMSKIEVLDIEGRLLTSEENINSITHRINLSSKNKGVYIIKIIFMNSEVGFYKLIKG